jgi:hypothetical protein
MGICASGRKRAGRDRGATEGITAIFPAIAVGSRGDVSKDRDDCESILFSPFFFPGNGAIKEWKEDRRFRMEGRFCTLPYGYSN